DGVGEREITPRRLLLEGHEILRPAIVAMGSPFVGTAREAGERHVEIVGGATHDAHAELGEALETGVAALEVGAGAGNDVPDIDRLARLGIRHETDRGRLVLQIEQPSHGACRPREDRMRGDVTHTLGADPYVALVLESLQEFAAHARRHGVGSQAAATEAARSVRRCSISRASACPPWPSNSPG